jgi:hypothetical protein
VEALEQGIPFLEGGWITVQQPMRDGHWTIRHPQTEDANEPLRTKDLLTHAYRVLYR